MSWAEVEVARKENRHELVLTGNEVSERIEKSGGLDLTLFDIDSLNYLNVHKTCLSSMPDDLSKLTNLQTLVLHSNKLTLIPSAIERLEKLKVLDLSNNALSEVSVLFEKLPHLSSINVSSNQLTSFERVSPLNTKLQVLDLANNRLDKFPDVCLKELSSLNDVRLNGNRIESIPADIQLLAALKNLDLGENGIKIVPGELKECMKLKELNLKGNPISDRRLLKLIDQCRSKQILDYVRQHCTKSGNQSNTTTATGTTTTTTAGQPVTGAAQEAPKKRGGGKSKRAQKISESNAQPDAIDESKPKIIVKHCDDDTLKIIVAEESKKVRPHVLGCLLHGLAFNADTLKRFIQMQTRLHEGVCAKRQSATIATHDLAKIPKGNLTYTARHPRSLKICPLNRPGTLMSGEELFGKLREEAESLRKEKKRKVYTGIHKYLYLLEGQKQYPCLVDVDGQVVSFPPITNSDATKVGLETTSIFVEVTSSTNATICKTALDALIKETFLLFNEDLTVQQVKCTDVEGNLKSVYPSKTDLQYDNSGGEQGAANFAIVRDH